MPASFILHSIPFALSLLHKDGNTVILFHMKTTLDIPDALYRRVKAKSALAGRSVRDVAIRLFSEWVDHSAETAHEVHEVRESPQELPSWFGVANIYAAKIKQHDMTAVRESIARSRE